LRGDRPALWSRSVRHGRAAVTEPAGLAFASTARATYNGQEVGVMHACGHDTHTAMLMGVAEVLASVRTTSPVP